MRKGQVTVRVGSMRWARREKKLSQSALAAVATEIVQRDDPEASISESLIALVETGRRQPSLRNAEAIAEALGTPLEVICDVADDEAVPA